MQRVYRCGIFTFYSVDPNQLVDPPKNSILFEITQQSIYQQRLRFFDYGRILIPQSNYSRPKYYWCPQNIKLHFVSKL